MILTSAVGKWKELFGKGSHFQMLPEDKELVGCMVGFHRFLIR